MAVTIPDVAPAPLLAPPAPAGDPARLVPVALASVYLIWGSTYLAMKWMVESIPPLVGGAGRFMFAGAILYGVLRARGAASPTRKEWLAALPAGVGLFVVGNGFVAIASQQVPSSFAAVVCAAIPLLMAFFGTLAGERPTAREVAGLVLGFTGVAVVTMRELWGAPLSAGILVLAPVGWALGSMVAKKLPQAPGLMGAAAQMLVGGASMLGVAVARGESLAAPVTLRSGLAFVYLLVVGSVVGFSAYSFLLRHTRASIATSYAYVNPVIAVLLGIVLGGEVLAAQTIAGGALVVIGVVVVVRSRSGAGPQRSTTAAKRTPP